MVQVVPKCFSAYLHFQITYQGYNTRYRSYLSVRLGDQSKWIPIDYVYVLTADYKFNSKETLGEGLALREILPMMNP